MGTVLINRKDEIIMKLVHYFITEENYTPIVVNGVKDEIWLENTNGPYRIIRINSNYIHNNEQYDFDIFKTKNIMKQIKKKTLSFSINTLNIFLDINPEVVFTDDKYIDSVILNNLNDIKSKSGVSSIFPKIKEKLIVDTGGVDLIVNVTKEINEKTEKDNKLYENTFKQKKIIITPVLIGINILIFLLCHAGFYNFIINNGANSPLFKSEVWRYLTSAFIHYDIMHLFFNMYALHIVGSQIETFIGRKKYLIIYLISAISGGLLSVIMMNNSTYSIGASGAIFGLFGALVYFGYHYRLYLGQALKTQIIPLIIFNLLLGFLIPNIDMAGHVGGLVGGFLTTIAIGVTGKSTKNEKLNGTIVLLLYFAFLIIMTFIIK